VTGIHLVDMLDVLRAAGCAVAENGTTDGWQTRARSSGGFPEMPLGIQWHHTASSTSPANDLSWMIDGSDDAPIGNVLLDRQGIFWPVAAGASNTAGKGGPVTMSRGTVPVDSGNSRTFAIEAANNGVGEPWPSIQIDAYFAGSNALNASFGNQPTDVFTHSLGAGDGWTDRKIDPATAAAVQGPWQPTSATSSGTWSLADIQAECARRATNGDDDMTDNQFNQMMETLDAMAVAQQAMYERLGTFGPKADQGISQRSLIYDAEGDIASKLDRMIQLLEEHS
jgi:hypothetical protein